ncbi:PD-(D/E)XK nuclease family protein [Sorangium sp. So ce363]|uniref:PD-(D/E)XK nuclease family protein n=1 Tax=Sorangium sp. So ce363 TaxID=3133304 RepID=UPI003F645C08
MKTPDTFDKTKALAEGVADLSLRESVGDVGIWTVVDFKTGSDAGTAHAAQEAQVRLYVQAIAEATGERGGAQGMRGAGVTRRRSAAQIGSHTVRILNFRVGKLLPLPVRAVTTTR